MAGNEPILTKGQRLELLCSRLDQQEPAANHDQALTLLASTLNGVEDEFSGVPYDPEEGGSDGRLYAPKVRYRYTQWERPGVCCYRQVAHATFVADNGAIEIRSRKGAELGPVRYQKEGRDGRRKVSDYDSSE